MIIRRRIRAFVLGAVPSVSLRGTCGRTVVLAVSGETELFATIEMVR